MKSTDSVALEQLPSGRTRIPLRAVTLSVVLAACVYLAMGVFTEWHSVLSAIKSIPTSLYAILIGLSLTSYLARFSRWLIFLRPIQPEISVRNHASIYFSGFALTTTPGKVGETIRSLYLLPLGVDYPTSLAAFFSERLLDVLVVAGLACLAMGAVTSTDGQFITVMFLFMALFFLMRSKVLTAWLDYLNGGRLGMLVGKFQERASCFLANRSLFSALPLSVIAWACQGVSLALIVDAFGFEANTLVIIGIYCLSILAGAASFIPGGIGVAEGAIALLLTGIGMDPAHAVAASIVSRLVTLWFAIAIGLLAHATLAGKEPVASADEGG